MKKNFKYALLGAIALTGAVSFSACSSSEDVVDNPDYNPETNSVKTEFTISLPNYFGSETRQTATIAQTTSSFRGMQDMVLIPYGDVVGDGSTPLFSKVFNLPAIDTWDLSSQNAKVYKTLDVPIGTKVFMFYGQAKVSGTNFENGKLNAPTSFAGAASTYNFTLEPILASYTYNETTDTKGYAICNYLKTIRATTGITSLELSSLLANFKPTAASSASIQAAVEDLWTKVLAYNEADATGVSNIKSSIEGENQANAAITTGTNKVTLNADNLKGYPANLGIPDGAVAIDWSTPATPVINGPSTGLSVTDLTKYVYPAALYYRANSTIGVSSNTEVSKTFSSDSWATIANSDKYTWNNAVVSAETRSIALKDQIQYAVGRFDLSILAENATLYDNYGNPVTVEESGFPVSAVIIGGQKPVKYDFTPTGTISYSIYDNVMNGAVVAKVEVDPSTVNHTLVLETEESAKQVNVAVELTNNTGAAFRGKDGTVPENGKFYLVGTLDLTKTGEYTNSNSRSKIFEQDYITKAVFTIKQGSAHGGEPAKDTNTTGLGAAYNVVPDLTVSQLEVAFSVDLTWKSGLEFAISF
jgi:hypothetical protein